MGVIEVRGQTFATVVGVVTIISLALVSGPVVGLADDTDEPSPVPASFYGTVSINGEPASEGTELVATINGDERGSITVNDDGEYGGPSAFDEKLVVNGNTEDENTTITFFLDGKESERTATWREGKTATFHVTLEDPKEDEDTGGLPNVGGGDQSADENRDEDLEGDSESVRNGTDTREDGRDDENDHENERADDLKGINDRDGKRNQTDNRDEDDAGSDDAVPGFGVGVGVVAILSCVLRSTRG